MTMTMLNMIMMDMTTAMLMMMMMIIMLNERIMTMMLMMTMLRTMTTTMMTTCEKWQLFLKRLSPCRIAIETPSTCNTYPDWQAMNLQKKAAD